MRTGVVALRIVLMGLAVTAGALQTVAVRAAAPPVPADQGKKAAHQADFLLLGTVFTGTGLALPGAEIRVRRAGERKARWEARTDLRGEFAVRVPRGAKYELSVSAPGRQTETRNLDASTGSREDLVFRLAPASGGKPK